MKRLSSCLLLLVLVACGSREEGTQLHLHLEFLSTRQATADGAVRQFTTAQGEHITLRRASVTLSSLEIFPCEPSALGRWLRLLSPIGTAEAHVAGSPRLLGTPHVSGLDQPDGAPLTLGTLRPPPGRYCRARLVFAPADADAEGLSAQSDMVGKTLVLDGEATPAGGGAARPFHVETTELINAEVSLEGLALSEDALEASRTIHLAYDQWLDGVELGSAGTAGAVLRNVARSTTLQP